MGNICSGRKEFEPDPDYIDSSSDLESDYEISYQKYSDGKLSDAANEKVPVIQNKPVEKTNLEQKKIFIAKEEFLRVENNLKSVRKILEELAIKNENLKAETRKKLNEPHSMHSMHRRSSKLGYKYDQKMAHPSIPNIPKPKKSVSNMKTSISAVVKHLQAVARNRGYRCTEKSHHSLVTIRSHGVRPKERVGAGHSSRRKYPDLNFNSKSFLEAGLSFNASGSKATTCIETLTRHISYSNDDISSPKRKSLWENQNQNQKESLSISIGQQGNIGKPSHSLRTINSFFVRDTMRHELPMAISTDFSGEQVLETFRERTGRIKDPMISKNMAQCHENNVCRNYNSEQRGGQRYVVNLVEQETQTYEYTRDLLRPRTMAQDSENNFCCYKNPEKKLGRISFVNLKEEGTQTADDTDDSPSRSINNSQRSDNNIYSNNYSDPKSGQRNGLNSREEETQTSLHTNEPFTSRNITPGPDNFDKRGAQRQKVYLKEEETQTSDDSNRSLSVRNMALGAEESLNQLRGQKCRIYLRENETQTCENPNDLLSPKKLENPDQGYKANLKEEETQTNPISQENTLNFINDFDQRKNEKHLVNFREQGTQTSEVLLEEREPGCVLLPIISRATRSRYALMTIQDIYGSRGVDGRHRRSSTPLTQRERLTDSDSEQTESLQTMRIPEFF